MIYREEKERWLETTKENIVVRNTPLKSGEKDSQWRRKNKKWGRGRKKKQEEA